MGGKVSKQPKRQTRRQKQAEHKTPENYRRAQKEKARSEEANRLNEELNKGE